MITILEVACQASNHLHYQAPAPGCYFYFYPSHSRCQNKTNATAKTKTQFNEHENLLPLQKTQPPSLFKARCGWRIEREGKDSGIDNANRKKRPDPSQDDLQNEEWIEVLRTAEQTDTNRSTNLALRGRDGNAYERGDDHNCRCR